VPPPLQPQTRELSTAPHALPVRSSYSQFEAAFPASTLALSLSAAGPVVVNATGLTLLASSSVQGTPADLAASDPRLKAYNQSLAFSGYLPLWARSYTPKALGQLQLDQYVTLAPPTAAPGSLEPGSSVTVRTFSCAEFAQRVPCSILASPPPAGANATGRRLAALTNFAGASGQSAAAGSLAVAPAPGPAQAVATEWTQLPMPGAGRHTRQCMGYFRQVEFLSGVTLVAAPSEVNATAGWALAQAPCGATYATATLPVSAAQFQQDMAAAAPGGTLAWCAAWPSLFDAPVAQPTLTVRGAGDPFLSAGELTDCTYDFAGPASAGAPRGSGLTLSLVAVGLAVLAAAAICSVLVNTLRPRVDYAPLLRDAPDAGKLHAPEAAGGALLGRAGYGAALTGAAARGGDIEVTTFQRTAAAGREADQV